MLKIRWSRDHLIFNMGVPILVRWHLYIETAPWCQNRQLAIMWSFMIPCGAVRQWWVSSSPPGWRWHTDDITSFTGKKLTLISGTSPIINWDWFRYNDLMKCLIHHLRQHLTHYGLLLIYDIRDLGQHWFKAWKLSKQCLVNIGLCNGLVPSDN